MYAKRRLSLFSHKAWYWPKCAFLCFPTKPDVGQNAPAFVFLQSLIWAKTCLPLFSYKAWYGPKTTHKYSDWTVVIAYVSHMGYFLILCRIQGTKLNRYGTIFLFFCVWIFIWPWYVLCRVASLLMRINILKKAMHVSHLNGRELMYKEKDDQKSFYFKAFLAMQSCFDELRSHSYWHSAVSSINTYTKVLEVQPTYVPLLHLKSVWWC